MTISVLSQMSANFNVYPGFIILKTAIPLKGIKQSTIWINYNPNRKTEYSFLEQII